MRIPRKLPIGNWMLYAALLCLAAAPAAAQEDGEKNWYVSGRGGISFAEKADMTMPYGIFSNTRIDLLAHVNFKTGWGASLAAGRRVGKCIRIESEALWQRAGIDRIVRTHRFLDAQGRNIPLTPEQSASTGRDIIDSGRLDVWAGMINAYWDVPLGGAFRPYVGAGAGTVHGTLHLDIRTKAAAPLEELGHLKEAIEQNTAPAKVFHKDSDRWDFIWQLQAGAGFRLSPSLTLQAGYRFVHMPSLNLALGAERLTAPVTVTAKPFHAVDMGFRLSF